MILYKKNIKNGGKTMFCRCRTFLAGMLQFAKSFFLKYDILLKTLKMAGNYWIFFGDKKRQSECALKIQQSKLSLKVSKSISKKNVSIFYNCDFCIYLFCRKMFCKTFFIMLKLVSHMNLQKFHISSVSMRCFHCKIKNEP